MIAVNSFYVVMKNYLKVYGEDETGLSNLITFLNREGDMRFAQDVCEEWQARVKQSFYKNKVDGMTDEDENIKWPSVFSLYGTTLLGMLVTDSFVFSFQIGDGDISVVTKEEVEPLVEPEKFLGTETHSLSKPDAWRKAVASVRRREMESEEPYMYILSTDGFVNCCFTFTGTEAVACSIRNEIIRNISLKGGIILGNILHIFTEIDKIVIDTVSEIPGRIHNDEL